MKIDGNFKEERNKMTKIGWCKNPDGTPGHVLNIVRGCPRGCSYCYGPGYSRRFGIAEKMAEKEMNFKYGIHWEKCYVDVKCEYEQLKSDLYNFRPVFLNYRYAQKLRVKPTMYFFSMSDPVYWKQEWYEKILEKIKQYPQHTFVVLTKSPEIYRKYTFPHNTWLGVTITTSKDSQVMKSGIDAMRESNNKWFISFEPLLENIFTSHWVGIKNRKVLKVLKPDWIIVGPETGNRKGRVIMQETWLDDFFSLKGIPVFMKQACSKVIGRKLRQARPSYRWSEH